MSCPYYYNLQIDVDDMIRDALLLAMCDFGHEFGENFTTDGYQRDDYHWAYEDFFKGFSAQCPGVLFKMYGESQGQYWVDYFRDGKKQTEGGEIVYGEFDERLLE